MKEIFDRIPKKIRHKTGIAGGYVRDYFLGIDSNDIDFVVQNSSEKEMLSLGFKQVGKDFPVFLNELGEEFALCRQERKVGEGYHGFNFKTEKVSFEEDSERRDLTINSMIMTQDGLIDPFNGMEDLKNKVLRHVGKAFAEDPLRVLRLARFSAKYHEFTIDKSTIEMAKSLKNELKYLTKERVFKELEKALKTDKPSNFFRTLDSVDCLDIVFPEIFDMKSFNHNPKHHAEGTVFEHTMRVLDLSNKLSNKNTLVQFAALFHDIGKTKTFEPIKCSFYGHSEEELNLDLFEQLQERYKLSKEYLLFGLKVAINHHRIHGLKEMTYKGLSRLITSPYFPKTVEELELFIIAIESDSKGRIVCEEEGARTLSLEEADSVFKEGYLYIEDKKYFIPESNLDIGFLKKLFEISKMKSEVGKFAGNMSVEQIKDFQYKERYSRIKAVMEN